MQVGNGLHLRNYIRIPIRLKSTTCSRKFTQSRFLTVAYLDSCSWEGIFSDNEIQELQNELSPQQYETVTQNISSLHTILTCKRNVKKVIHNCPQLISTNINYLVHFLKEFGARAEDIKFILEQSPHFFVASMYLIGINLKFFLQELEMSERCTVSIMRRNPYAFTKHPSENHTTSINKLRNFGLDNNQIKYILSCNPQILDSDFQNQLSSKLEFFYQKGISQLHFQDMIQEEPLIIGISDAKINQIFRFLEESVGLQEQEEQLRVVHECPDIFCLPVSVLERKWRFLKEEIGGTMEEVYTYPCYLSSQCSLLQVIGPRIHLLRDCKIPLKRTKNRQVTLELGTILSTTDKEFCVQYGIGMSEKSYSRWKEEWLRNEGAHWHGIVSM